MLGTTRFLTDESGQTIDSAAYTAFGERVTGSSGRFGYVGAHGYQTHTEMPYQHVGNRYYDPTSGRFLQRDPIGVGGALNVYAYVANAPTVSVDPSGLFHYDNSKPSFWPPNSGRYRYGPSSGPGRPPGSYAFRFPGPKGGPHLWGARGAAAFGLSCAIAVGVGVAAGRVIDNTVGRVNRGFSISDGLADILYNAFGGGGNSNYNPWG